MVRAGLQEGKMLSASNYRSFFSWLMVGTWRCKLVKLKAGHAFPESVEDVSAFRWLCLMDFLLTYLTRKLGPWQRDTLLSFPLFFL